ncbi:MAG: M67 family metallopeptidase [Vicinamibacterales bacterium]
MDGAVLDRLVQHARAEAPGECCGLLAGRDGLVLRACPTANSDPSPTRRYRIDPAEHVAAVRACRADGMAIVGAYHSHPRGDATPSATDAREAFADFLFVIVGLGGEAPEIRGWRWDGGNFMPVRLVRTR